MKINNYRFQQQQQKRQEYKKVKQIKKKFEDMPVDATEEIEYMKKLLSGETVENFKSEDDVADIGYDSPWGQSVVEEMRLRAEELVRQAAQQQMIQSSKMSLSDYLHVMGGKGYYK